MMSGLWCFGLLCLGRMLVGIMVGCCVFSLSFCRPSCVASRACSVVSFCGVVISIFVWVLKSLTDLLPRSILIIGHLPPLCFSNCSCNSLNVILCRDVHSLELCLQPPNRDPDEGRHVVVAANSGIVPRCVLPEWEDQDHQKRRVW